MQMELFQSKELVLLPDKSDDLADKVSKLEDKVKELEMEIRIRDCKLHSILNLINDKQQR